MRNFLKVRLLVVSCLLLVVAGLLFISIHTVRAQDAVTANCDVCGYCQGIQSQGDNKNPPSDWLQCKKCLYPQASTTASDGDTIKVLDTPVEGLNVPDSNNHYTMIGCISTVPGKFTSQLTTFLFSLVGGIAFLFLLYGAAIIATSRGDYEKLNQGKRIVFGAIAGLLFVLFATLILRIIAVNILKIPGFGS